MKVIKWLPFIQDGFLNFNNQLVNHLDKLEVMSDGEWKPNVIVRVGKGSDKPLDLVINIKSYTEPFKQILTNCERIKKSK